MFAVKNVVGYIENPGVGLGFWYVSIPINSYPLMFSKISSELKMRWLWHKPDFGGNVYRIRVKLAPGCDLPHDVFNGLVGSTTNTFRIQFDIYIPSYTTDDYDALIMNVVSLGSGNAVNPTDYIDTELYRNFTVKQEQYSLILENKDIVAFVTLIVSAFAFEIVSIL